jgi:hypothetical protein
MDKEKKEVISIIFEIVETKYYKKFGYDFLTHLEDRDKPVEQRKSKLLGRLVKIPYEEDGVKKEIFGKVIAVKGRFLRILRYDETKVSDKRNILKLPTIRKTKSFYYKDEELSIFKKLYPNISENEIVIKV